MAGNPWLGNAPLPPTGSTTATVYALCERGELRILNATARPKALGACGGSHGPRKNKPGFRG